MLKPSERIIVAADYAPMSGYDADYAVESVSRRVLELCDVLSGTGVTIKINSILRAAGYQLIHRINQCGLSVFADLKLVDIPVTLKHDGEMLAPFSPRFVTVMSGTGKSSIESLKEQLPDTIVLGVTVLTTHDEKEVRALYGAGSTISVMVDRFAERTFIAKADGCIASPTDIATVRANGRDRLMVVTPGVRLASDTVVGDDQNLARARTPHEAFLLGADAIVVGRPITQHRDPRSVVETLLREVDEFWS